MKQILILGLIIMLGFIGNLIYMNTRIPEPLLMIFVGSAVGPVFGVVSQAWFEDLVVLSDLTSTYPSRNEKTALF